MKSGIANQARRLLINFGKVLPFALCGIVMIAYTESLFALATNDFLAFGGTTILNTPLSFLVANLFELDILAFFITLVISIAIEACKWNIISAMYIGIHLLEKNYFETIELCKEYIYVICIINIIICGWLVYNGIRILVK